jgi:hypothetical protein
VREVARGDMVMPETQRIGEEKRIAGSETTIPEVRINSV